MHAFHSYISPFYFIGSVYISIVPAEPSAQPSGAPSAVPSGVPSSLPSSVPTEAVPVVEMLELVASDGAEGDRFGSSVSMDGTILVVGTFHEINEG